jgi:hypothetical protein
LLVTVVVGKLQSSRQEASCALTNLFFCLIVSFNVVSGDSESQKAANQAKQMAATQKNTHQEDYGMTLMLFLPWTTGGRTKWEMKCFH